MIYRELEYFIKEINEHKTSNISDLIDLEWIEIDPTSQACGSYNPIIEDPRKWYKAEVYYAHGIGYNNIETVSIFNPILYKYYESLVLDEKYDKNSKVVTFYGYDKLE